MNTELIFLEEFVPHLTALSRTCFGLTRNAADAEELYSATLEKVICNLDRYTPGTLPLAYMRKVALRLFLNQYKKILTRKTHLVDNEAILQYDVSYEMAILDRFEDLLAENEYFSDEIRAALEKLKNDEHFKIFCCVLEGYTTREIAEIFDAQENTIKGIIRRVRIKLINELSEYAFDEYGITPQIKMSEA